MQIKKSSLSQAQNDIEIMEDRFFKNVDKIKQEPDFPEQVTIFITECWVKMYFIYFQTTQSLTSVDWFKGYEQRSKSSGE